MENVDPYINSVVYCIENYIFKISFSILSIRNSRRLRDISYKRWAAGELKQSIINGCVGNEQVRVVIESFIKKIKPIACGSDKFNEFNHVMYVAYKTVKEIKEILKNKNYI